MNQILKKLMVTALFIISALFSENSLFGDGFVTSRLKTEQAWTTGVAQETRLAQEQREKVAEETFAAEGARVKAEQEWATEERARIAERKAEEERARVQVLESLQDYPAGDSVSFHEDGTQWGDQLQELLARKTAQEQEQREKVAGETFAAEGARLKAEQEWATEERARIAQARHTRIQEARLGSSEYVESAMVAPEAVQPVAPDISPTILQESPAVDSFVKTERTAASNANKQAAITRQQAQAATQERTALENVGKLADAYVELVDSEKKLAQDESDLTAQLKRNEVLLGHAKSGVKVEQLKVERKDDDLLWDAVVEGDQQLTDDQITADRRFALYEQEAKSAAEFEEFVAARKAAHEQEAAMRQQQIYRKRTENDLAVVDVAGEKYLADIAQARHSRIQEARLGSSEYVEPVMVAPEAPKLEAPDLSPTMLQELPAVDSLIKTERIAASNANKQAVITRQQAQAATQERTALENVGKLADAYVELVNSEKNLAQDESDLTAQLKRDEVLLGHAKSGVKVEQLKVERKGDDLLWDAVVEGDQQLTDDQIAADRRRALYARDAELAAEFEEFVAARKARQEQVAILDARKVQEKSLSEFELAAQLAEMQADQDDRQALARKAAHEQEAAMRQQQIYRKRTESDSTVVDAAGEKYLADITQARHTRIQEARLGSPEYVEPVMVAPEAPKLEASDISPTILQESPAVDSLIKVERAEAAKANKQGIVARQQAQAQEAKRAVDQVIALSDHEIVRAAQQQTTESYTKVGEQYLAGVQAKRIEQAKAQAREVADQREELTSLSVEHVERIEDENNVRRDAAEQAVAVRKAEHAIIQEARLGSTEYIKPVIVAPEEPKLEAPDLSPTILQESPAVDSLIKVERAEAAKANKQGIVARQQAQAQEAKRAVDQVIALSDHEIVRAAQQQTTESYTKVGEQYLAGVQAKRIEQAKVQAREVADQREELTSLSVEHVERIEDENNVRRDAAEQAVAARKAEHAIIQQARLGSTEYIKPVIVAPEAPKLEAPDISPTILQEASSVSDLVEKAQTEAAKANKQVRQQTQVQEAKRAVDQAIALSDHEIVRAAQQQTTESYTKVGEQYLAGVQAKRIEQAKAQAREVADQRAELTSLSVERLERIEDENNVRRDAAEQAVAARKAEHAIIQEARLGSAEYIKPVIVAPEVPKLEAPDISPTILGDSSPVSDVVEQARVEAGQINKQAIIARLEVRAQGQEQALLGNVGALADAYLEDVDGQEKLAKDEADLVAYIQRDEMMLEQAKGERALADAWQAQEAAQELEALIQEACLGSGKYTESENWTPERDYRVGSDISPTILKESAPVSDLVDSERMAAAKANKEAIVAHLQIRAHKQEQTALYNVGKLADEYQEIVNGQAQDFVNRRKELIYVPSENVEYVSDEDNVRRSAAVEIQGQADVIAVGQVHTLIEDYKKTRATEAVAEQEQLGRYNKALDVVLMDKAEQGFFDDLESDGWRLVAQIKHDEALLEQEKSGIKFEQPKTEWTSDSALWDAAAEGDQQLVNEQAWDAADWGYGLEKWLAEQDELDKQEVTTFWTNFDTLIHMNKQKSQTGWTAYFWDSTTQLWNTTRTRTAQSFVLLANALPAALLVGATGGGALYVQWDTPQVKKARKISVDYMDRMRNGVQEMRETVAYWMVRGNERARAACASGTVVLKNKADVVAEYVIYAASVGKETTQRVGGILYKYVQQAKEVVSKSRMGQGLSNAAEYAAKKIHMD